MQISDIINAIQKEVKKNNNEFFEYAWREKLNEFGSFLKEESKYARLVDWINKELSQANELKDIFSPADRNETTTLAMVNTYGDLMKKIAILVHCKEMLLDNRTTTKMRDNIEYTICKLYRIRYSNELEVYI